MPVAPESPSSQHNAPAPADQRPHHTPLPGHQRTSSGNVLLSELAAAASAASRGVVLPPLRSLVENNSPSPQSSQPAPAMLSAEAVGSQQSAAPEPPQPATQPATQPPAPAAEQSHLPQSYAGHDANKLYADPPAIALSQPLASESPPPPGQSAVENTAIQSAPLREPQQPQASGPAGPIEHLQAPSQMGTATLPGLRVPSPARSSVSSVASSVGSHESAVSPVTSTAATSPALRPHQLAPGATAANRHRVLAPAPSPLMPSPQGAMSQLSTPTIPGQIPSAAPTPQHQHHAPPQPRTLVPVAPNGPPPARIPAGMPHTQTPGLRPTSTPQIVYVNPYGYPIESMPYMYPAPPVPHAHYGYPPQPAGYPNAGYGAPVPMMHMPPPPQVVHSHLGQMPTGAPPAAPGMPGGGAPVNGVGSMDMKPGMAMPPHMMQPWAHTFSQEIKRRTRTGCLTCRRRRVKCDEQHPQCRNCLKSERVCLGYDVIFSFDRAKRVDHLMHRRRLYRASRNSRSRALRDASVKPIKDESEQSSLSLADPAQDNKANLLADEDGEEERTVLRSWSKVVELFRNRLAGPLDELLGSDMFVNIARRTADYLNASDQRFVNVAGELEAMRQLLAVVYPSFTFEGLNILESQIALEKLRTTEDYCLLRGVAECLTSEEAGASIQEMISPTAAVRRTIHQQHLQRIYTRLALLHRILHPRRTDGYAATNIKSTEALGRAAQLALMSGPDDQQMDLSNLLWSFLKDTLSGTPVAGTAPSGAAADSVLNLQGVPAIVKLAERNDSRAVLALLAIYAKRPTEGELHDLLNRLSLHGLPMALLEIGMASRT